MDPEIFLASPDVAPIVGVMGHAGVGHAHSHSNIVQDDSAGFAVASFLMARAVKANTLISNIEAFPEESIIVVYTSGGGVGKACVAGGITPYEKDLLQRAQGENALFCQRVACKTFGRIYGQGISEAAVAMETAAALAVVDTFVKTGANLKTGREDINGNCGCFIGGHLLINGIPTAVMASVNATAGGLGPNEDLEGNVIMGCKGDLMNELGLHRLPTAVIESKAFVPAYSDNLEEKSFWIRACEGVDNEVVARCLKEAAEESGYPFVLSSDVLPLDTGALEKQTHAFTESIITLAEKLKNTSSAAEKVQIIYQLVKKVREDAGSVTFMSNSLHDVVRAVGLVPGTGAMLSLLVPPAERDFWKIPVLNESDLEKYVSVIAAFCRILSVHAKEAALQLEERFFFPRDRFENQSGDLKF